MKLTKEDYLGSLKSWVKYSPWEWVSDYCDDQGRCWFEIMGQWKLTEPKMVYNTTTCLPFHIDPI